MREPTLKEVNAEIRKVKRDIKANEEVRFALNLFTPTSKFVAEIDDAIEHQKEIIKCLETIKEKLL